MHPTNLGVKPLEPVKLISHLLTERSDTSVLDIAEKMLNADFFGLFGPDFA